MAEEPKNASTECGAAEPASYPHNDPDRAAAQQKGKDKSMRKNSLIKAKETDLQEMKKLFPAPILSSESLQTYYTIMARFMESLEPRDFIEKMFVKDLTDATFDMVRFSSHKMMVIEREHEQHHEKEVERLDAQLGKLEQSLACELDRIWHENEKARKAKEANDAKNTKNAAKKAQATAAVDETDRVAELEAAIDAKRAEIKKLLKQVPEEQDHAKALLVGIEQFEQLDRLQSVAIARRNNVLAQLELYRQGLGQRARRVSDEIIDAEFEDATHKVPSIAPVDGPQ